MSTLLTQSFFALSIVAAVCLFVDGVRHHPTGFDQRSDEIAKTIRDDASERQQKQSFDRVISMIKQ